MRYKVIDFLVRNAIRSVEIAIIGVIFCSNAYSKGVIEDFADKDLTDNPTWNGDTADFRIYKGELRLDTTSINTERKLKYIATESTILKDGGQWLGWFHIGTTPTANNYIIYTLASTKEDMRSPRGYFVKIGGENKNICLLKSDGDTLDNNTAKTITPLITSKAQRVGSTNVKVFIKVTRDTNGKWTLASKLEGENDYTTEGTAIDTTYKEANYAGITLGYTKSSYDRFGADNIRISVKDTTITTNDIPLNADSIITEKDFETESTLYINEIMPNATKDETEEYIELTNTTDREISLWQTWVAVRKKDGSLGTKYYVPYKMEHDFDRPKVRYIEPHGYVCLSEAPELDSTYYMAPARSHFIRMDMPGLNDLGACVVIGSDDGTVHDEVCYTEEMYGETIKNKKNVAIERGSTKQLSLDKSNWKAGPTLMNYGTPGYKNGNTAKEEETQKEKTGFWLESDHFSPNNDGFEDVLIVNYNTRHDDYGANFNVYNTKGQRIKNIYTNILLSAEGSIEWDGTNDNGEKVKAGMYIMIVEQLSAKAKKIRSYKLPFAVTTSR